MPRTATPAPSTGSGRVRASALPPEARRAAIVAAAIPVLIEHGAAATTRQLAEAAGVAEGTIFRVFPDKNALVEAVVETALDPEPTAEAFAAIAADQPLERRLEAAVVVLQRRVATIWRLLTAVGMVKPPEPQARRRSDGPDMRALAALLEPDATRLRRTPAEAAQVLRGLTFACSHPALADEPLPASEIVELFLDGVRAPSRPRK